MSLETDVANLVTKTTQLVDYFNGKKTGIDAAVAAAIAAVPINKKVYCVHPLLGLDTNDGTIDRPLKTIEKAISNTPVGGVCSIRLMADYNMAPNVISVEGVAVELRSDIIGTRRIVRPTYFKEETAGATVISCFSANIGAQFCVRNISFELPSANNQNPAPTGGNNALIKANTTSPAPVLAVKMIDCDVIDLPGATANLLWSSVSPVILGVVGTSFPVGFAGRYMSGVAAGTQSHTVPFVSTNLPTL